MQIDIQIAGYPIEYDKKNMGKEKKMVTHRGKGRVKKRNNADIIEYSGVQTSPGQSGSPILAYIKGRQCVIGIHIGKLPEDG